jgi:hypothetical protein
MRGRVAPRAPDGLSDTPGPFGKIIFILNGPGVPVSLLWRQMVVDEDEAVSIVNESEYGLTTAIYSADTTRAFRVARRIDVGMVFINNYFRGVFPSGLGTILSWRAVDDIFDATTGTGTTAA